MDALYKVPLICPVGTCYAYQNITFSMMGNILEKATHKNYTQLITENIFKPLKMSDASTTYSALLQNGNYADCHQFNEKGIFILCPMSQFAYELLPAGGINVSLSDLIIWLQAQIGCLSQYY